MNNKIKFLKIKEAADYLGVTEQTLRNWDKSGKLEPQRHVNSNYRLYDKQTLDKIQRVSSKKNFSSQVEYISRTYLDTSVLIKYLLWPDIKEPGSIKLQNFLQNQGELKTTILPCIYESIKNLERKSSTDRDPNKPSYKGYLILLNRLSCTLGKGHTLKIRDFDPFEASNFKECLKLGEDYSISFVDASLIVCMLKDGTEKCLLTADKNQARCASAFNLKVELFQNEK